MRKHLLVIYHPEIENSIVGNFLKFLMEDFESYLKGEKKEVDIVVVPLLSSFVLVKTSLKYIDCLKDIMERLEISGLKPRLIENVFEEQYFHIMYKNMNEMAKIPVTENVKLFEQLELNGF